MNSLTSLVLDLQAPNLAVVAAGKQNDLMSRKIAATLRDGDLAFIPPAGVAATIRYAKPDGTAGWYDVMEDGTTPAYSISGNVITFILAEQMLTVPGRVPVEINFYTGTEKLTTFSFILTVEKSVLTDNTIISSDYFNVLTDQVAQAVAAAEEAAEIAANLPRPSDAAPQPLGPAAPGVSALYSRADHVHPIPSASDVGAVSTDEVQYKIYDSVTDVGLTSGSATISGAWTALRAVAPAMLICQSSEFASAQLPEGNQYGTVTMAVAYSDSSVARGWVEFHGYGSGVGDYRQFLSSSAPSGTWVYASVNWKAMWTNNSPSSDYSSGTIPLDLGAFSEVMIVFNTTTSSTYTTTFVTPIDGSSSLMYCVTALASSSAMSLAGRYVSATSTGVTINAARVKLFSSTSSGATDNSYFIPYKIYAR